MLAAASSMAAPRRSAKPAKPPKGTSFEERLAAAKSVKTITDVLGVALGATLADAHARLDPLSDPARPPKYAKSGEGELKALWQLENGRFASVYVKTNEKREIEEITGFVRPGEEIPFAELGEVEKAPVQNDHAVVWDIIRRDRPQMRLVAEGTEGKARLIKLFVVPRPTR